MLKRYGGTLSQFTGDGIMAVFGAPVALEDHAVRACLAALGLQEEAKRLAAEVQGRDGIDLRLRVGLNSGQVIAGEIGSGSVGYTAIGEQVGMAQGMESVAPPGAVMLSASTARLVDSSAALGEAELVRIKGADKPVAAQRLLGIGDRHRAVERAESNLVGRRWEMSAIEGLLDRAIDGHGAVVGVVEQPGIGKSRLVRELSAMASARGVEVFTTFCESHTSQIPFHAIARLLRVAFGVEGLDTRVARDGMRDRIADADREDLVLFDDLLGIADPDTDLPRIDPDARRRRLTALVNAASLARTAPALYVIEDAHWIDERVDAGRLLRGHPAHRVVGVDHLPPRVRGSADADAQCTDDRACTAKRPGDGSPGVTSCSGRTLRLVHWVIRSPSGPLVTRSFAEEIVREVAERGVVEGKSGAYISTAQRC